MKTHLPRLVLAILIVAVAVTTTTGCVTSTTVTLDSAPQGAEVRLDNQVVGTTPTTVRLSNAVWEDPVLNIRADGYRDMYGSLQKEVKAGNLIVGLLLFWPSLLWCFGPQEYQYYDLIEE